MVGLTTTPDFDLGDGNFGEDAEAMNGDLARVGAQDKGSGLDAPAKGHVSNLGVCDAGCNELAFPKGDNHMQKHLDPIFSLDIHLLC